MNWTMTTEAAAMPVAVLSRPFAGHLGAAGTVKPWAAASFRGIPGDQTALPTMSNDPTTRRSWSRPT